MAPAISADLAAVTVGSKLYLYYQEGTNIYEVTSEDGVKWTKGSSVVGDDCQDAGSPITAYYVTSDGPFDNKATIHVLYIDSKDILREQVKVISNGESWQAKVITKDLKKAALAASRLSSGVCHGSHQWAFFEERDTEGAISIAEVRNGSGKDDTWVHTHILPEAAKDFLPGTSIAANINDATSRLFFQGHSRNIYQAEWSTGGKWLNLHVLVSKEKALISTPIATCSSTDPENPHVFYVAFGTNDIHDILSTDVIGLHRPGTKLAATAQGNKVFLFHVTVAAPTSISTTVYDGKSSGKPIIVVK